MKVYEALAEAFQAEGVDTVFGLMGNGNQYWWHTLVANGVRVVPTRHEGPALTMAEGWARATGRPGVATVTEGPGVTQLGTALTVAGRARVPLVVFGGAAAIGGVGARYDAQYLDQRRFVEATDTPFIPLLHPGDAHDVVREAFYIARSQSRPVFLDMPRDIQFMEFEGHGPYVPSTSFTPEPQRIRADPERLGQARDLLLASSRPVLVVGKGVEASDALEAAIKQLADRIGALISVTLPMKGWGNDSPYYAGVAGGYSTELGRSLFATADCVVGIGATLNGLTIQHGSLFPDARFVQIDLRPGLLKGDMRAADVYLQGDAYLTVTELLALLGDAPASSDFRTEEVRASLAETDPDPQEFELDPGTLDPRRVAAIVDEALPADVGTVFGNGHSSGIATLSMRKRRGVQWYIMEFGCIGQALPTAIGGAAALAPRAMAVIDGDASVLMHIGELETAARLGIKLLVVVLNDQAWGAEYHKFVPEGRDPGASIVPTPDIGAVARALGCRGELVTSEDRLRPAIGEFLQGEGPMLLDVRVSRSVPSVHYRRRRYRAAVSS